MIPGVQPKDQSVREPRTALAHVASVVLAITWLVACGGKEDTRGLVFQLWDPGSFEGLLAESIGPGRAAAQPNSEERWQQRREALRRLRSLVRSDNTARSAAGLGLVALFDGRYDTAIASLRSAAARDQDWQNWNDLTVVLLERARAEDRPLDYVRALAAAKDARDLAPDRLETRFNFALALSKLHLRRSAERAWDDFLETSATSLAPQAALKTAETHLERLRQPSREQRWEETRQELESLDEPLASPRVGEAVRLFPSEARVYAERQLVGRWSGTALNGNRDESERWLALGSALGSALVEQRHDYGIADIFAFIRRCPRTPAALAACASAHAAFAEGVESFFAGQFPTAERRLAEAVRTLSGLASPLERWADFYLIYATFHQSIPESYEKLCTRLSAEVEERYPAFAGQVHWRLGVAAGSLSHSQEAREHYLRGQELFTASGGPAAGAFGHALLAEEYDDIGDVEQAWRHRLRLFAAMADSGAPRALHSMLNGAVQSLMRYRETRAAGLFLDELVMQDVASGLPEYLADAYRERGEYRAELGDGEAARDDLARARALVLELGTSVRGDQMLATIDLAEGATWIDGDPARARDLLSRSLAAAGEAGNATYHLLALEHRARANKALDDLEAALADYQEALGLLESQRSTVHDTSRALALRPAQSSYDAATSLLVTLDRPDEALTVAERARSRFLLDLFDGATDAGNEQLTADEIERRLPGDTLLVEYAVLGSELITWTLGPEGLDQIRTPISAAELDGLVATLRDDVESGLPEGVIREQSARLYDVLIKPLADRLAGLERVVFVPDRPLFRVPFTGLYDRQKRRYLVESLAVAIVPSATLFLDHRSDDRRRSGPRVVVAAPDLEGTPFADLPPLAGAMEEARLLSALDNRLIVLSGSQATRDALFAAAADASLLHFAGHALANVDQLDRSLLLLAPSPDHDGALTIDEILGSSLLGTPVVVLSACRTADGFTVDREGPLGLAEIFFATGSQVVMATLWDADDLTSPTLLRDFHAALARGERASAALRHAILNRLAEPESSHPFRSWANFSLFESAHDL